MSLSQSLLDFAAQDLNAGTAEDPPNSNNGPRVGEFIRHFGLTPPQNWCACAIGFWMHEAEKLTGIKSPIAGSPGALENMAQLKKAGCWMDKKDVELTTLQPGMIVIWLRMPLNSGHGHIGVIHSIGEEHFFTIEGNTDAFVDGLRTGVVGMREHSLTDPLLLGFGKIE